MNVPTRVLLTCAAIGTAGGLLLVPVSLVSIAIGPIAPLAFAVLSGLWNTPFVLALALLRRPGVALLASLFAGIVNAILTPVGASAILTCLMVGAMVEIPLALGLYRSWRAWIFYVGGAVFALAYALYSMAYLGAADWAPWTQVAYLVLSIGSSLGSVWLGRFIAARLAAAGLGRGTGSPDRERVTAA